MDPNELYHHGVRGMKWGVRRTKAQLDYGSAASGRRKKNNSNSEVVAKGCKAVSNFSEKQKTKKSVTAKKKTVLDMSDEELRERISRLQLEKQYKDLMRSAQPQTSKGKRFVMSVLETSGKNIATQVTTYMIGKAVNKAFADIFNDQAIVNPKKGQKDK